MSSSSDSGLNSSSSQSECRRSRKRKRLTGNVLDQSSRGVARPLILGGQGGIDNNREKLKILGLLNCIFWLYVNDQSKVFLKCGLFLPRTNAPLPQSAFYPDLSIFKNRLSNDWGGGRPPPLTPPWLRPCRAALAK